MGIGKVSSLAVASLSKVSSLAKLSISKINSVTASFAASFTNAYSIDFDGSNDYVVLDDVTWGYGTVSLWFKTPSEGSIPLSMGSGQFVYLAEKIYVNWPKHNSYLTYNYRLYDDDNWHHLLCTFDNGASKMYYDGELVVNSENVDTSSVTAELWFGQYGGGGLYFDGNLDEISWWNGVTLDADAVTAVYNSGVPINLAANSGDYDNATDLTNWWRMGDGDTYPTIEDNVASLDGTMTNMVSGDIVTVVPS